MTPTTSLLKVIKAMTMIQILPVVEEEEVSEEDEDTQMEDEDTPHVVETPGARDLEMTWTVLPAG